MDSALNDESVRPVADRVTVQGAEIFPYSVEAGLHLYDGVVAGPCLDAANAALAAYLKEQAKLGRSVRRTLTGQCCAWLAWTGLKWSNRPATSSWTARRQVTAPAR